MIFRAFSYFDTGCASYLFGCGSLGTCTVIDSRADDVESDREFAAAKGMQISGSLCGTGLSGKPTSTIAFEKRWNPMLSMPREAFIDALADVPAKPVAMEAILAFNRSSKEPVSS